MEQGKVVAPERDAVVEPDAALVDKVERGDRDPQLGTALLRIEPRGIVVDLPAVAHRQDRDAGEPVELAAKVGDLRAQGGGGAERGADGAVGEAGRLGGDRARGAGVRGASGSRCACASAAPANTASDPIMITVDTRGVMTAISDCLTI